VFLLLRATPGDPVDAVLGNRAPIVSKRRIERLGYQNLCRCSTSTIWDPYCGWIWEFYRPGSRRLVSDQQYFPATVELAAFSMAVALIIELALVCPHRDQARFSI